ncbi:hypothetical protein VZO05_06410 [Aggregatilineales bacterium SYSU G02658]
MTQFFRRGEENTNNVVGIILLVMLLVFSGPTILPTLLARTLPFADEGVPCTRLRLADNRGRHQSYIGRSSTNPLALRVIPSPLPPPGEGALLIRMVIENTTIGTVPIVFDERQIIIGDDPNSSGFGLIFRPANGMRTIGVRQTQGNNIQESFVRLLGPRQRCVHRVTIPAASIDPIVYTQQTSVSMYYRILTAGATPPGSVFPDQGLARITGGFLESSPVELVRPDS